MEMALSACLFAANAYWRQRFLARKKAALNRALEAYEDVLAKPFG